LVDDNPTNLQVLYQTLEGRGYRLLAAKSGKDALTIASRVTPDLVLLDVMMPHMDGFETCARLKADTRTHDAAVIFLSALTDPLDKVRGLDAGAVDFINKPFQAEEVLARVRTHLELRQLQKELRERNNELRHELTVAQELLREARARTEGVLLGDSSLARRLREEIREAALSEETVLISGPPGSDHEAVARAIHHQSARSARAIICVNCLALADFSPSLGQTGGSAWLDDKLQLALGGTLYVEGIQHLTHGSQRFLTELLRGLEAARRAGAGAEPDVRLVLSTTRDVDDELAAGRLTPELHRALPRIIDVPPLRSRLDDLESLAPFILRQQAELAGRTPPKLSDEGLKRLKRHRWPGNVRELRNVLGAALAVSAGAVLEIGEHLLDSGLRVGSYRLVERLGAGGMGEVWLGRHQLLARPAAIKIVRDAAIAADGQTIRERFAREAQTTAELRSPHTVQLFDFGLTETGSFYYVMEQLRGLDLQRMVERHGPTPPERAVCLLKQACRSLSEAHALGLVHRDIKPANLFVCRLGQEYDFLKVLDFGVVSRQDRDASAGITMTGMVLGTPAYLAPELLGGAGSFDHRVDLYALGCVAYWLLTGRTPFDTRDTMTLLQHSTTTPPAPSQISSAGVSPEMDALILECLSKDPSGRPATADVLWERLDRLPSMVPWDHRQARRWWDQHEPDVP
jgi:DNA-binding NtrC family response regulator